MSILPNKSFVDIERVFIHIQNIKINNPKNTKQQSATEQKRRTEIIITERKERATVQTNKRTKGHQITI